MNRETAKERVKQQIKCTDYLERSKNGMYCCPACHSGHGTHGTGAVKYYADTNTWHCHACDTGGDVIDLYEAQEGCTYNEALTTLAAIIGITIDTEAKTGAHSDFNSADDKQTAASTNPAQNVKQEPAVKDFTEYYKVCAARITDPAAVSYLIARGITLETAQAHNLGYDPEADPAGAPGSINNEYKAHATPRIVAPCSSSHYVARSIDPDTPKEYKALNPNRKQGGGEVAIFNLDAIHSGAEYVFVVEGIFDALSLIEAGQQAIALNSKGNGNLLLQELKEHPADATFIICPDNDEKPEINADTQKRAAELAANLQSMEYKAITYNVAGDYHDENDELTQDATAFIRNISAALEEAQRDELTDFLDKVQTKTYKPHATGLPFFDNLLSGGIVSQSLLLLIAAPGAGKTTLCQQLAETMAEHKTPVIYYSLEMSTEQMLAKAISAKYYKGNGGDMSMLDVLQGYNWTDTDRAGIIQTLNEYRQDNYPYIKYNPAGVTTDVSELLQRLDAAGAAAKAAGKDAPAVIVDYLQLLKSSDNIDIQELIKRAVEGLKQYAVQYDTFVIGIIAANRESNKRGRLTLESGRDSSGLEYTADYQISLNFEDIDNGKVNASHVDEVEKLKMQNPRRMILRALKTRLTGVQRAELVTFDAKHNIFHGTAYNDFITASDAPAFEEERPQVTMQL